jgi:hypothetical protein
MNKAQMEAYRNKHRSQLGKGDYKGAQRTSSDFTREAMSSVLNSIGSFFRDRREAKERERERQEQLRREREASERRAKIIKICIIFVFFIGIGVGGFFLINRVFFTKATSKIEASTPVIISEEVFPEIEQRNQETNSEIVLNEDIQVEKDGFFSKASHFFSSIGNNIKEFFIMIWNIIKNFLIFIFNAIKGFFVKIPGWIKNIFDLFKK